MRGKNINPNFYENSEMLDNKWLATLAGNFYSIILIQHLDYFNILYYVKNCLTKMIIISIVKKLSIHSIIREMMYEIKKKSRHVYLLSEKSWS